MAWDKIAKKVWHNECDESTAGLTSWNEGEDFPSLGIGHFIWYPANYEGPFQETFSELLLFLEAKGAELPGWIRTMLDCPWSSREEFLQQNQSFQMNELRIFLSETVAFQAEFMVKRLERALPRILEHIEDERREEIAHQFYRVAQEPMGNYALLDYLNFKGEGINPEERYQGKGWGLLQVLEEMSHMTNTCETPLQQFKKAAIKILSDRVGASPAKRREARWLPGWFLRLNTYTSD